MLNTIETTALRIALGAYHTSPASSLQIESDELPLEYRRKQQSLTYAAKLAAYPNRQMNIYSLSNIKDRRPPPQHHHQQTPFNARISEYVEYFDLTIPTTTISQNNTQKSIEPWKIITPKINMELNQHNKNQTTNVMNSLYNEIRDAHPNQIPIYTDGSITEDGRGCAVVYPDHTMLYRLPPTFTIFSCELFAIKQALYTISQTNDENQYNIFSDSQSAIVSIKDRQSNNNLVQEVHTLLTELSLAKKAVSLTWIPSHSGILGNEQADASAKEATRQPQTNPIPPTTHQDIITYIKRKTKTKWKDHWLSNPNSKLHDVRGNSVTPYKLDNINRKQQAAITRLRIGHSKITHSHIISRTPAPTCDHCNTSLTVQHVIIQCPQHESWRKTYRIPKDLPAALNEGSNVTNLLQFIAKTPLYGQI